MELIEISGNSCDDVERAMSTTGNSWRGYANAYAIPSTAEFQQLTSEK
jgi:hypothetical protein